VKFDMLALCFCSSHDVSAYKKSSAANCEICAASRTVQPSAELTLLTLSVDLQKKILVHYSCVSTWPQTVIVLAYIRLDDACCCAWSACIEYIDEL